MQRAHIVYCHPESGSFVRAMAQAVRGALEQSGWEVTVSDLYAKSFNPVASESDFLSRSNREHLVYALEQRHAYSNRTLAPDIAEELELVLESELLILAFPIFWCSMPGMLKGWIDRVFLSGTFYGGMRVYDRAGMVGRKALVLTSLGGREHMFGPNSLHGELTNGHLRHLLQGTLGYVGYSVYEPFVAYHVPYISSKARESILSRLDAEVRALGSRALLRYPALADYDDEFRLKRDAHEVAHRQLGDS